jgi:hypothetical protein
VTSESSIVDPEQHQATRNAERQDCRLDFVSLFENEASKFRRKASGIVLVNVNMMRRDAQTAIRDGKLCRKTGQLVDDIQNLS